MNREAARGWVHCSVLDLFQKPFKRSITVRFNQKSWPYRHFDVKKKKLKKTVAASILTHITVVHEYIRLPSLDHQKSS